MVCDSNLFQKQTFCLRRCKFQKRNNIETSVRIARTDIAMQCISAPCRKLPEIRLMNVTKRRDILFDNDNPRKNNQYKIF
jgi:hypothetical protein